MSDKRFNLVYPTDIRDKLEQLADIYAPPLTSEMVKQDYSILRDVEVIFSSWGGPKMDQEFLSHALI